MLDTRLTPVNARIAQLSTALNQKKRLRADAVHSCLDGTVQRAHLLYHTLAPAQTCAVGPTASEAVVLIAHPQFHMADAML